VAPQASGASLTYRLGRLVAAAPVVPDRGGFGVIVRPARQADEGRWVDLRSAVAVTGIRRIDLIWAMVRDDVRVTTTLPGHEGVPMVFLHDVVLVAPAASPAGHAHDT
jgi:hypothetical protein